MVLSASGGKVSGRTLLQKRCYFVGVLLAGGETEALGYQPHYYGPYSQVVADALASLRSAGFVTERPLGFGLADGSGFEVTRYDYQLTAEGAQVVGGLGAKHPEECRSIEDACKKLTGAPELDYVGLSIAAKAYHVLGLQGRPMTYEEICKEAKRYSWAISSREAERAAQYLETIGLVTRKAA
jgi:hypothetical protein